MKIFQTRVENRKYIIIYFIRWNFHKLFSAVKSLLYKRKFCFYFLYQSDFIRIIQWWLKYILKVNIFKMPFTYLFRIFCYIHKRDFNNIKLKPNSTYFSSRQIFKFIYINTKILKYLKYEFVNELFYLNGTLRSLSFFCLILRAKYGTFKIWSVDCKRVI